MYLISLVVTFVVGLSLLIGTVIALKSKNISSFINFSISLAFSIMILLVIYELIPEAYHSLKGNQYLYPILIMSLLLGTVILKIIDLLIPNHEHNHNNKHGEENNMYHIGIIASIALVLHNVIEGMALYGTILESVKTGVLLGIGIGLHNIPMGMIIASTFLEAKNSKKKTLLISTGLALSTLIGGLILLIFNSLISAAIIGILLAITAGMLIYICLFELLPQIFCEKNKKLSFIGIIIGVIIFLVSSHL